MNKNIELFKRPDKSFYVKEGNDEIDVEAIQNESGKYSIKTASGFVPFSQIKSNFLAGRPTGIEMGYGQVASDLVKSFGPSAVKFGKDVATPFVEPVETGKALGNLALGLIQKLTPGVQPEESTVDAVGDYLSNRYGSGGTGSVIENIKRTIAKDPVGVLGDLSMILSGGSLAAVRIPGKIGQVARTAGKVGQAIDPILLAGKGVKTIAKPIPSIIGGLTGTGGAPLKAAYAAGVNKSEAFLDAIKGDLDPATIVTDAKAAIKELGDNKIAQYKKTMGNVKADTTTLDFKPIQEAVNKVKQAGKFEGQTISGPAAQAVQKIDRIVRNWKKASVKKPKLLTAEGIDALKRKIFADVIEGLDYGTAARGASMDVYNGVKKVISDKFPEYSKAMKEFEEASIHLDELQKTLSLSKGKTNIDTPLRKLTSIMRNNVNTNYGQRTKLAQSLGETKAGSNLIDKIAGTTLDKWTPRGLQLAGGALPLYAAHLSGSGLPLLGLPFQSPKLMGYGAYGAGRAADTMSNIANMIPGPLRNIPPKLVTDTARVSGILANEPNIRNAPRRRR